MIVLIGLNSFNSLFGGTKRIKRTQLKSFSSRSRLPDRDEPLTAVVGQRAAVDLVLHHVGPVQHALVEVEVQGDGVPQARHQHAELALVQVDASDLVPVGEDDEGLERVCRREERNDK